LWVDVPLSECGGQRDL